MKIITKAVFSIIYLLAWTLVSFMAASVMISFTESMSDPAFYTVIFILFSVEIVFSIATLDMIARLFKN